ncbi:dGTP triphosphohydrolase [Methylobacterium platani]|uniref:dGTP triphosphohydrolase n=1 Tax=Methylobacterium platani TaxID=427683 RepID=UPI000ACE2E91|nr:dNTP triphosphohydrolase [Methylobacterium platani]
MAGEQEESTDDGLQGLRGSGERSGPEADHPEGGFEEARGGSPEAAEERDPRASIPPCEREAQERVEVTALYSAAAWQRKAFEPETPWRPPVMRDYARVIHSASFRRLQGKTQVFPGHESDFFRNRLTHSLEVAQIAEGIALQLNYTEKLFEKAKIDTRLCSVAALLHDLGHPPFGHNGERPLDDCMKKVGGFEGNAQTVRIISRVEKKLSNDDYDALSNVEDERVGLNLTLRTIASVIKYDRKIDYERSADADLVKGYYATESNIVELAKTSVDPKWRDRHPDNEAYKFKTIECSIMDIADDIAYSTYDLEDCFKAGFITPGDILASSKDLLDRVAKKIAKALKQDFTRKEVIDTFHAIFESADATIDRNNRLPPINEFSKIYEIFNNITNSSHYRTEFTSQLVNEAIRDIEIEVANEDIIGLTKLRLKPEARKKVEVLKNYTYEATIYSARVKVAEFRGYEVVKGIFDALSSDKGFLLMPEDLRQQYLKARPNSTAKMRAICDFIAGMTDRYALEFYARLHSDTAQSIFKPL